MGKINCNLKSNANTSECKKRVGEGKYDLVLPKRDNSGQKIDNKVLGKVIKKMNKRFGGTTTKPSVLGCFRSRKRGRIECEENIEITAVRDFDNQFTPELGKLDAKEREKKLQEDFKFMKNLAKGSAEELGQEAVMVTSDRIEDATFIAGKRRERIPQDKIFDDVFSREI